MRFRSMAIKASIVLGVLVVLSIASVRWHGSSPDGKGSSGPGIFLAKPAFAQEDGITFLEQEAGIAAYTNVGRSIDLDKARNAFKTVEHETAEYIIGSVWISGYAETDLVHAYVHGDGWVVVYYLEEESAAKIVDWVNYSGGEINGTKLEIGLAYVSSTAEVPVGDTQYYNFKYPDANRLMIVAEAMSAGSDIYDPWDEFRIKLPSEFDFYERSFSLNVSSGRDGSMYIDNNEISTISSSSLTRTGYGLISSTRLSLDEFHIVKLTCNYLKAGQHVFGAIVLIYREG